MPTIGNGLPAVAVNTIFDRDVFVPTVEDVIITKLRWSHAGRRRKDLEDVENVIAVQGDRIDWDYVTSWCDRHGTRELLDSVRMSVPQRDRSADRRLGAG